MQNCFPENVYKCAFSSAVSVLSHSCTHCVSENLPNENSSTTLTSVDNDYLHNYYVDFLNDQNLNILVLLELYRVQF